jgi:pyrrolidone-carboxylate peptidase
MAKNLIPSFAERTGNLVDKLSNTFAGAGINPGELFDDDKDWSGEESKKIKLTEEEKRAWDVRGNISKTQALVKNFSDGIDKLNSREAAAEMAAQAGTALFNEAVKEIRTGWAWKDNNLYWTRLIYRCLIKKSRNKIVKASWKELIARLEEYSRGRATVDFGSDATTKKVLISGFEPFQIAPGQELSRGNPSGLLALSLHNSIVNIPSGKAKIQSVIWSNRYDDFDSNLIENFYKPYFKTTDLIITFSLDDSSTNKLHIERFAANYRGGGDDNNFDVVAPGRTIPMELPYYETTLPYKKMVAQNAKSGSFLTFLREDYDIVLKDKKVKTPTYLRYENNKPENLKADLDIANVAEMTGGSGGDYFSNEIFFRVARTRPNDAFPYGHIHVPAVDPSKYDEYVALVSKIIQDAF